MPNTARRVGIAIIAAGLLLGMPLQVQAKAGSGRVRTVSALTNFTEPPGTFTLSPDCPGPECGLKGQYITTLNGPAIFGYEEATLYTYPDPAQPGAVIYHGTAVFHVTKSPCGTGTFEEIVTNGTADHSRISPDTRTVPVKNDWTIISGSGTGQLVGIEGSGTDEADIYPNGRGEGVHYGELTCRLHK